MNLEKLILGIDIGTSSVKIILLDINTSKSIYAKSVPTNAKISPSHPNGDEQDVAKIFSAMQECLKSTGNLMKQVLNVVYLYYSKYHLHIWHEKTMDYGISNLILKLTNN